MSDRDRYELAEYARRSAFLDEAKAAYITWRRWGWGGKNKPSLTAAFVAGAEWAQAAADPERSNR